jgi:lysyl-tRNA synthetase class 2
MRPEKNEVKLNDEERKVFDFMKKNKKVEIEMLKNYAELSNKKWDKTIKSLTKNKLLKVFKNDSGIFVELT